MATAFGATTPPSPAISGLFGSPVPPTTGTPPYAPGVPPNPYTPIPTNGTPNISNPGLLGGIPGFTPGPNVPDMSPLANVPQLSETDLAAKQTADYGQAKQNVGLETRGALSGLSGSMAGRGIVGSGVEGRGQYNVVGQGQQQLGAVDAAQAAELANMQQQVATTNYQGNITQRGQTNERDIAGFQGDINERGQTIGAQEANLNALVSQRGQSLNAVTGLVGSLAGANAGGGSGGGDFNSGGGGGGGGYGGGVNTNGMDSGQAYDANQNTLKGQSQSLQGQNLNNTLLSQQAGYNSYLANQGYLTPQQQFSENALSGLYGALGINIPGTGASATQAQAQQNPYNRIGGVGTARMYA